MLTPYRNRFDQIFDEMMALDHLPVRHTHSSMPQMALDLAETDADFKIKVDVPGVQKENVTLDATPDNQLIIKAERRSEKRDGDGEHYHRVERSYGAVSRTVRLPETADLDTTTAKMEDGVLEITVGKREPPKTSQRITIT
ncbi:hypothetical protein CTAYLR_010664 [Chrysophaeum taylorii]|uniref:SHSP domain-containing protein n=1 Tax=Chrysophaeum taylorii TaxID=2483200 RepID=A0AAD7U5W4_9STRA|nr:hypothetical protein CTAYLR_010664 [Chrysophaeum taylorii]